MPFRFSFSALMCYQYCFHDHDVKCRNKEKIQNEYKMNTNVKTVMENLLINNSLLFYCHLFKIILCCMLWRSGTSNEQPRAQTRDRKKKKMSDEEIHARLRKFLVVNVQILLVFHWIPGNTIWFPPMVEVATKLED